MSTRRSEPQTVKFRGADGLTLVADEWNQRTRRRRLRRGPHPSVLMLHGGGQNRYLLEEHRPDPGRRRPARGRADSRGHGDSDRSPDANYSVEALCADTLAVLDQIGRPVVLIGASMGGMTGILAARRSRPGQGHQLILVDVVPRYEKDGSARIRDFMSSGLHGFESLEEAADAVAAYLPHRTKPRSPEGLKKNLRHRDGRWFWHWDPAFLTKPARRSVRARGEARAGSDGADHPDPADPRQALRRGQRARASSDFLEGARTPSSSSCPDAGHTAAGDDNDAFTDVVVQFVRPVSDCRAAPSGFNFLEQPRAARARRSREAQAEEILAQPLRPDGARATRWAASRTRTSSSTGADDDDPRRAQDRQPRVQRDRIGGPGRGGRPDRRGRADAAGRGSAAQPCRRKVHGHHRIGRRDRLRPAAAVPARAARCSESGYLSARRGRGPGRRRGPGESRADGLHAIPASTGPCSGTCATAPTL